MANRKPLPADAALDRIEAVIRACTSGLTGEKLICLDTADVMVALEPARNVPTRSYFGVGTAAGPDRARRAAEAALADLRLHVLHDVARPAPSIAKAPRKAS